MTRKRKSSRKKDSRKDLKGKRNKFRESSYEVLPRKPGWKGKDDEEFEKVRFRLPIKTDAGWLLQEPLPLEDEGIYQ